METEISANSNAKSIHKQKDIGKKYAPREDWTPNKGTHRKIYLLSNGRLRLFSRLSIFCTSLIPKGELTKWLETLPVVGASGSISIERQTSWYMSPRRSKGASIFPPNDDKSLRSFFKINMLCWKNPMCGIQLANRSLSSSKMPRLGSCLVSRMALAKKKLSEYNQ